MANLILILLKLCFLFLLILSTFAIGNNLSQFIYFDILGNFHLSQKEYEINVLLTNFLSGLLSSISGIICCNIFFHKNGTKVFILIYAVLIILLFFRYISIYNSIPLHISFWGYEIGILIIVSAFSLFMSNIITKKIRRMQ